MQQHFGVFRLKLHDDARHHRRVLKARRQREGLQLSDRVTEFGELEVAECVVHPLCAFVAAASEYPNVAGLQPRDESVRYDNRLAFDLDPDAGFHLSGIQSVHR